MAKSMRSKRVKRLRAIRRDMVEPFYDNKDAAKLAAQEAALSAPKLPARASSSSTTTTTTAAMDLVTTNITTSSVNAMGALSFSFCFLWLIFFVPFMIFCYLISTHLMFLWIQFVSLFFWLITSYSFRFTAIWSIPSWFFCEIIVLTLNSDYPSLSFSVSALFLRTNFDWRLFEQYPCADFAEFVNFLCWFFSFCYIYFLWVVIDLYMHF